MHQPNVAVIGAAGPTGRALVAALIRRGVHVRPLVHRGEQKALFPEVADIRTVELDDLASLAAALENVEVAYYVPPTYNAAEEMFGRNVIAASSDVGLQRLIYHSVLHAHTPAMRHHIRKAHVELAIRESALAWTILQPAMYVQTSYAFLSQARDRLTPGFDTRAPFTPIDLQDLAEAAAVVASDDGHAFATYELAGNERITFEDMGAAVSSALKQPVQVQEASRDQVIALARTRGFSEPALEELGLMLDHYDHHGLIGNSRVLQMLLGRPPTTFEAAVARDLGRSA